MNSYAQNCTAAANSFGLPPSLVDAICNVESGYNTWACRFEPKVYARLNNGPKPTHVPPCSPETEVWAMSASWGLMQVMGETARGLGFNGAYLSVLTDPDTGLKYGCRLLAQLVKAYKDSHGWQGVVAAYNAGKPKFADDGITLIKQDYVDKVNAALGGQWPA